MNYRLEKQSSNPAYLQLYNLIRDDIVKNIYPYMSKLPSKRTIAVETGVSVITVEHAVTLLEEEGYIETRERSGYFVVYKPADFNNLAYKKLNFNADSKDDTKTDIKTDPNADIKNETKAHAKINANIDIRTDVKEIFPFTVLAKTMRKVLLDYSDNIMISSPNNGLMQLRNEICAYLARSRHIFVNANRIVIGSGAEYLYGLIAQLFKDQRIFAVEDPCYSKIRQVYEQFGIQCDPLSMNINGIESEELRKTRAKILHVTPFNSFPTSITADISKKNEYLHWASVRNGYLIEDNYDSEFTVSRKAEEPLFSMSRESRVIYVNTFSKTIAPSMRAGYMILPENLLPEYNSRLGFYSCTVPVFEQYVLAELLKQGDYERHINRVRRRRRMKAQLSRTKPDNRNVLYKKQRQCVY